MDLEAFRRETAAVLSASGRSQVDVAEALGITQPNLSRALKVGEARGVSVLRRVVGLLTPYEVVEVTEPRFRVQRKAASSSASDGGASARPSAEGRETDAP